jgi:hypothetical protein
MLMLGTSKLTKVFLEMKRLEKGRWNCEDEDVMALTQRCHTNEIPSSQGANRIMASGCTSGKQKFNLTSEGRIDYQRLNKKCTRSFLQAPQASRRQRPISWACDSPIFQRMGLWNDALVERASETRFLHLWTTRGGFHTDLGLQ